MNKTVQNEDVTTAGKILRVVLVVVALTAFSLIGFLLYRFVQNDGRLSWNDIQTMDPFGLFESAPVAFEQDERMDSRHWSFILTDSTIPIHINTSNVILTIIHEDSRTAFIDMWLEGAAVEPGAYTSNAELTEEGELSITIEPSSAETKYEAEMVHVTIGKPYGHPVFLNGKNTPFTYRDGIGSLTANLTKSNVQLFDIQGTILVETSGAIHAERCTGSGLLSATHGTVTMQFNDGRYIVSSDNSLTVTSHFGSLVGSTSIGNITAEILHVNDSCSFTTGTGDISLLLPQSADVHLQTHTPSGAIVQSLIKNDSLVTEMPNQYDGILNQGQYLVRAFSQSGTIRIEEAGGATEETLSED